MGKRRKHSVHNDQQYWMGIKPFKTSIIIAIIVEDNVQWRTEESPWACMHFTSLKNHYCRSEKKLDNMSGGSVEVEVCVYVAVRGSGPISSHPPPSEALCGPARPHPCYHAVPILPQRCALYTYFLCHNSCRDQPAHTSTIIVENMMS